jgi:hypothetical protein
MRVKVGGMMRVGCSYPVERDAQAFLKPLHGLHGDIAHIKVVVVVLCSRVRA